MHFFRLAGLSMTPQAEDTNAPEQSEETTVLMADGWRLDGPASVPCSDLVRVIKVFVGFGAGGAGGAEIIDLVDLVPHADRADDPLCRRHDPAAARTNIERYFSAYVETLQLRERPNRP